MSELQFPHRVVATIQESIGPIDRGSKYADPLDAALKTARAGEVQGAGSQLQSDRTIAFVDIDVALADLHRSLDLARATLKRLGAPTGSTLTFPRDGEIVSLAIDNGEPVEHPAAGENALDRRLIGTGATRRAAPPCDPTLVEKAARNMLASYRRLMVDAFHHVPIDRAAYDPSVFEWYDHVAAVLSSLGFDALGDLVAVADSGAPLAAAVPFVRRFVSRGGLFRADIVDLRIAKQGAATRALSFVSEFTGGRFLSTTTAPKRWATPEHISVEHVPAGHDVAAVLGRHLERHKAHLREGPHESSLTFTGLDSVLASENRCHAATAEFRRRQAVPSVEELTALGTKPAFAAAAHAAMVRMVRDERAGRAAAATAPERPVRADASRAVSRERPAQVEAQQATEAKPRPPVVAAQATASERPAKVQTVQATGTERPAKVEVVRSTASARPSKVEVVQLTASERPANVEVVQSTASERPAQIEAVHANASEPARSGAAWKVTPLKLSRRGGGAMPLRDLIEFAIDHGIRQAKKVSSPLHPQLILDTGRAFMFVNEGDESEPLEIVLKTLAAAGANANACALVMGSKMSGEAGSSVDAVVVMASSRGGGNGQTWAQTYRPQYFLTPFKLYDFRERIGDCRNFFDALALS